jgi:conjugal transfer pilus assembly protein TraF
MANFKQLRHLPLLMTLSMTLLSFPSEATSWYNKEPEGWLWYKRIPKNKILKSKKEEKAAKNIPNASSPSAPKKPESYREQMKKLRQAFEEVQAKAILSPTLENVSDFQRAQNTVLNQADVFQKMLMMAAMLEGQDKTAAMMASPVSRDLYRQDQTKKLDQEIRKMTKGYGLFFIFKNDCPYCHQFAPVVKEFVREFDFDIKAISKDVLPSGGSMMKEFPEAAPDNGTIPKINPEGIYPALFLINPQTREVIPVAKGLINKEQLKENFRVIIQYLKQLEGRDRR